MRNNELYPVIGMTQNIVDELTLPEGRISEIAKEIDRKLNELSPNAKFVKNRSRRYNVSQTEKGQAYAEVLKQIRERHMFSARRALLYFLEERAPTSVPMEHLENPQNISEGKRKTYRKKLLECALQVDSETDVAEWSKKLMFLFKNSSYAERNGDNKFVRTELTMAHAIEIAFTFSFTPEQTDSFCSRVLGENPFPPASSAGLIYYYCLKNKKPYTVAQEILREYKDYCSNNNIEKKHRIVADGKTKTIQAEAMAVMDDAQKFKEFLKANANALDTRRASAISIYRKLAEYYAELMQNNYEPLSPVALFTKIRRSLDAPEDTWDWKKREETRVLMLGGRKNADAGELKEALKKEWYYLSMPVGGNIRKNPIGKNIGLILDGTSEPTKADMLILLYKIFCKHMENNVEGCGYADTFYTLGCTITEECGFSLFYAPAFLEYSILTCLCANLSMDVFVLKTKSNTKSANETERKKHKGNEANLKKQYRSDLRHELDAAMCNISLDLRESTELVQQIVNFFSAQPIPLKVCFREDGIYAVSVVDNAQEKLLYRYKQSDGDVLAIDRFEREDTEESYKQLHNKAQEIVNQVMEQLEYNPGEDERNKEYYRTAAKMYLRCICSNIRCRLPKCNLNFEVYVKDKKIILMRKG